MSDEIGFTHQAADLLLGKSFSFDLRQIKRDMRQAAAGWSTFSNARFNAAKQVGSIAPPTMSAMISSAFAIAIAGR